MSRTALAETALRDPAAPGDDGTAVTLTDRTTTPPDGGDPALAGTHAAAAMVAPAQSLLRFITCGSVDDGKSTLIGRLLYETGAVFSDQLEALSRDSRKYGTTGDDLDFALLVDGLSAEREQGITIDVAYRYFSTANRAFIIADTPGHEQYTRNMATGASQAELAIILVDARKGILPQTRRHSFIASLVGIKSVVVAVNKMDLVDYDETRFEAIRRDYEALVPDLGFSDVTILPLSARGGDNVTTRSPNTPWYAGPTLLDCLETASPDTFDAAGTPFRLPVQWVNRPNADFRGFSGTIAGGAVRAGDAVTILPEGRPAVVAAVHNADGPVAQAGFGESVTVTLDREVDVSRGDVIVAAGDALRATRRLEADILWMSERALVTGGRYLAKLGASTAQAAVKSLDAVIDIHSYEEKPASVLSINAIGRVHLTLDRPSVATAYDESRDLGAFILVDATTNETVALGVVKSVEADAFDETGGRTADTNAGKDETGLGRLVSLWQGGATPFAPLVRFRAAAALLVALLGLAFGLGALGALALGIVDFIGRPFLMRAFGLAQPHDRRSESGSGTVDWGGGI